LTPTSLLAHHTLESKLFTPRSKVSELPSTLNVPSLNEIDDEGIDEVPTVVVDRSTRSYVVTSAAPPHRPVITPLPEEVYDDMGLGSLRVNLNTLFDEAVNVKEDFKTCFRECF
jgi:hypothetical protein